MLLKIFSLICLLYLKFCIRTTICSVPTNIQNLELEDVTSSWDKFPSFIDKIKEAVSRFRCPKGWKRLGGSCYYYSNLTSILNHVNYTCNYIHSNHSNLIQIRNAVELFYAAHVLSRNNLTSLMIEIHPSLLKGKKIASVLMKDDGRWERMKNLFPEVRAKYQRLKRDILDRLSSIGLRILRRSKKIKPVPPKPESNHDEIYNDLSDEYEYDDRELHLTNITISGNNTLNISAILNNDEYEYDDLDSPDEADEFEKIQDLRGICDDIHWNVLNDTNNTTVYILTKYNMSDKTICSLSEVEPETKYHYICEYVLDFCFANIFCGKHGHCVNTLSGFKCACSFLYGGLLCEKISENGYQIILSVIMILILATLSLQFVRNALWFVIHQLIKQCKKLRKSRKQTTDDREHLVKGDKFDNDGEVAKTFFPGQRRLTIAQEIAQMILRRSSNPLLSPVKRNFARTIWVGGLCVMFLILLFVITTFMYYVSFGYNLTNDDEHFSINETIRLVTDCARISDYRRGNLIFAPCACALILLFSWSIKREKACLKTCDGRPGLIPPIEPFHTGNRFTTATVFGILAFEVLKIFEELLFSTGQPLEHGVLVEALQKIALVIVVGLRYYPVLASLQLRNIVARFFACLYIISNIIYTIVREGSCMGFLPLSGQYTVLEEAKLRRELGTWFIIYGLIKNIPHFFFLSYIGAELCVRFAYDSIHVVRKKNESIWSAPIVQLDESEFAKYYVTKLFRRYHVPTPLDSQENNNPGSLVDHEYEHEQQTKSIQYRIQKFISDICQYDEDFRFTTMALCTYTVAVVFLYYLACTFVFLYVSRTTGHVAFLKYYFKSTFDVDLGAFSFKTEIILSAVFTAILYGVQLFVGMKNYKRHKLELYKGICTDIPLAFNFQPSAIASNSVHYSGFLVGYMAWGFVICFHVVLVILIGIRVLSFKFLYIELILSIIVPILVIYLLKMLSMASAGKFLFIQKLDNKLNLQSRKTYAVFLYFSFFADCFLGIASSIIRLIKATCLNVIFMARLDWSFHGRPLEKFDHGFAAYVSYLHMEVAYTNPVMLAFCYSLFDDIVKRRPRHCYADECCIAPGELESDNDVEMPPTQQQVQQNNDESREIPMTKISPKTKSQNQSIISTSEKPKNVKKKGRLPQPSIVDEERLSDASSTGQLVSQQQPTSRPGPIVPPREDHPSGRDESNDDDKTLELSSNSTVEKLIPQPKPRVKSLPPQSSRITTDNRTESVKKKTLKRRKKAIPKPNTSQEEEEDDDHDHPIKNYDTIKMIIPSKQPLLGIRRTKEDLSSTDDSTMQLSKQRKGQISRSMENVNRKATKIPDNIRMTEVKVNEKRRIQETTLYSSPPAPPTNSLDRHFLRNISYLKAQQSAPSYISPVTSNQNNTKNDSSHYSEIATNTIRSGVSNYSYPKVLTKDTPSSHSNKQKENDHTNLDSEEDGEQESGSLLKSQPTSSPTESTNPSNNTDEDIEEKRIKRRKRLRFRWHFLYTILNNYHLLDLRKGVQSRLTLLHLQRSNLTNERLLTPVTASEVPPTITQAAAPAAAIAQRGFTRSVSEVPASFTQRPSPLQRLVSVPVSVSDDYPISPAERYVAIRAQMLYNTIIQQPSTPYSPSGSHVPTTVSGYKQQLKTPLTNTFSGQSLGFRISPDVIVHPPSEHSSGSTEKQILIATAPRISARGNLSPSSFQAVSTSNQSTAAYPIADSSVASLSTYRTQMSHEQHMRAWRQNKVEINQKKQKHAYIYGESPQPTPVDRVSTAAILTPQLLSTTIQRQAPSSAYTDGFQRGPTPSPFQFPPISSQIRSTSSSSSSVINDTQIKPKTQKSKVNRPAQDIPPPPPRMDRLDEDPQETSSAGQSPKATSALIHRQNLQSSVTDNAET